MKKSAYPELEEQRLAALEYLKILDTPAEENIDRLTRIIKSHFGVSIVLVSLIDQNREWIKSKQGMEDTEFARAHSLGAHAILGNDFFCIPDAREDPRFADNPYVTGAPHIHFYAAVPITVEGGLAVGVLSIMDTKQRKLSVEEIADFMDFRDCVEVQLIQPKLWDNSDYLASQSARLNTLLESVPDGIVTIDEDGKIESLNTQAAHIFGYEPHEILGRELYNLIPSFKNSNWDDYVTDFFGENWLQNSDENLNVTGQHKDGTLFSLEFSVRVMYVDGLRLYTGVLRDITDRKRITDELQRGQQLLEITKENVPVGITVFDGNQELSIFNQESQKLFELPDDYAQIGTSYREFIRFFAERGDFGVGDINDLVESRLQLAHNKEPQNYLRTVQGKDITIEVNTRPMPGGGFVSVYQDITEKLRSEQKLETLVAEANIASQAKTDFLSSISHEIRTPLNGVLGVAQMLSDTELSEDQREKLNIILRSGNTLLDLINSVLDMSKIETGKMEIENIPCDLRDVISSITKPFEITANEKGVTFQSNIDHSLAGMHNADPTRLRQIIMNLLSNALKFTEKGSVILSVHAHIVDIENRQQISISVEDSGIGIAEDRLTKIFESFSQADSTVARKFGGTGLGLTIVKDLVSLMEGNISVMSEVGVGSCFEVTIPLAIHSQIGAISENKTAIKDTQQVERQLTVLVAEDNEVNAMITTAYLEKYGHDFQVAKNGVQALKFAGDQNFDLILMDINMPEMDGLEATNKLRQINEFKSLPIIGLTADAFLEHHIEYLKAGMDDVLTKPFTEEQLVAVISKNMSRVVSPPQRDVTEPVPVKI